MGTLSVAIKNAILMILIILIFHFLIKNYLFDRDQSSSKLLTPTLQKDRSKNVSASPLANEPTKEFNNINLSVKDKTFDKAPECEPFISQNVNKNEEDLYKFVFENDDHDSNKIRNELDYKTVSIKDTEKVTEEDEKEKLIAKEAKESISKPTENAVKTTDAMYAVLNEYENENIMNGGDVFKGILGYDGTDVDFVSIDAFYKN